MKEQRGWDFRSCNRTRWGKNRERKSVRGSRLANTEKCKEYTEVLGLANYYRQFIKDFARIAKPLHEITRKYMKQNQREKQQKAFEELKERFMIELVLVIPDLDKEIRVEVDILDFAIEEVLSMKYEDKKWRLVAYISKLLNKAERNYEIYDKEILAIIRYLEA